MTGTIGAAWAVIPGSQQRRPLSASSSERVGTNAKKFPEVQYRTAPAGPVVRGGEPRAPLNR
jgi:hypothetical protein